VKAKLTRGSAAKKWEPEHPRGDRINLSSTTDLVRSAEKFIASGKFALAQEQLASAQVLDPDNQYIAAILDRIKALQQADPPVTVEPSSLSQETGTDSQRYLSVTVGTEFKNGVRSAEEKAAESPSQLQTRIRRLTNAADGFLESGSLKNAFESLMKAYLLDPMSPYVIACEKTILPAWEHMQSSSPDRIQGSKDTEVENPLRSPSSRPRR
jgi:hypothetical protein